MDKYSIVLLKMYLMALIRLDTDTYMRVFQGRYGKGTLYEFLDALIRELPEAQAKPMGKGSACAYVCLECNARGRMVYYTNAPTMFNSCPHCSPAGEVSEHRDGTVLLRLLTDWRNNK
jgi:hypothetical protein